MTAVEFVEDSTARAPSPRLANRVVADAQKRPEKGARRAGREPATGAAWRPAAFP
jgi:hypothetical protein